MTPEPRERDESPSPVQPQRSRGFVLSGRTVLLGKTKGDRFRK